MEVGPPVLMSSILIANPVVKCKMPFGRLWPVSIRNMVAKVTGTMVERATKGEKGTKDGRRMVGDYLGILL